MIPLFDGSRPTPPLQRLLELTGAVHDGTPAGICAATQQVWRQEGVHQGRIEDRMVHLRDDAVPLFQQLGYIGEQLATGKEYRYALVGGAYQLAIKKRLALLLREWHRGVRFQHLVLLSGERPAAPDKESLEQLNAEVDGLVRCGQIGMVPKHEAAIMDAILWTFEFPAEWKANHSLVCAPRVEGRPKPDPTGEETISYWLTRAKPEPGSVLMVYSQPGLSHMQRLVRRQLEPLGFPTEVIGYAPAGEVNVSMVLDSIAKAIYEDVMA